MKKIYFLFWAFYTLVSFAQSPNQNPNHKKAFLEYSKIYKGIISLQGTTSDETYKAYDYMELKEEEKEKRRYWRHLERLAYNSSPKTYLNSWGWDNDWRWRNSWDYGWNDWDWNNNWNSRWNTNWGLNFWQ